MSDLLFENGEDWEKGVTTPETTIVEDPKGLYILQYDASRFTVNGKVLGWNHRHVISLTAKRMTREQRQEFVENKLPHVCPSHTRGPVTINHDVIVGSTTLTCVDTENKDGST